MISNIVLSLPILCLLGSTVFCAVCLWKVYWKDIHIQVHRMIEETGLWKMGKGRWRWLARETILYIASGVISILIPVLSLAISGEETLIETVALTEIVGTFIFATATMLISLVIYGIDFSNVTKHLSNFCAGFFQKILTFAAPVTPVFLWLILGALTYRGVFDENRSGWSLSVGSVLQLSWGIVSFIIMVIAIIKSIRDLWRYTESIF